MILCRLDRPICRFNGEICALRLDGNVLLRCCIGDAAACCRVDLCILREAVLAAMNDAALGIDEIGARLRCFIPITCERRREVRRLLRVGYIPARREDVGTLLVFRVEILSLEIFSVCCFRRLAEGRNLLRDARPFKVALIRFFSTAFVESKL